MKKTVRIIAAAVALIIMAAFLSGCGNGSGSVKPDDTPKDYDVVELAKQIFENCTFEDQYLAEVEDRLFALNLYNIDPALVAEENGVKQSSIYVSSAYPEMIVCIKAVDDVAANSVMEAMKALINNYIENYSNYNPAQIEKLRSAVGRTVREYVVVAVTMDNEASGKFIDSIVK